MTYPDRYRSVSLATPVKDIKQELRDGLTAPQKTLPAKWLYDETGSHLFEQICELPEYYLTRTERGILERKAESIIDLCPSPLALVELGSGSAVKTRYLIAACLKQQPQLDYYPIDVSPAALEMAADGLLPEFAQLNVIGLVGEYSAGLEYLSERQDEPHLTAFLGSSIGNLSEEELHDFFTILRSYLRPIDRLLLGFDLLKDESLLIPAYNDSQGITAQFNLNMLARLNQDFAADFDLSSFEHKALFNSRHGRIEMHLVSKCKQTVRIPSLDLEIRFHRGETIHTEKSHKYSREGMTAHLKRHGFAKEAEFTDAEKKFCLVLVK